MDSANAIANAAVFAAVNEIRTAIQELNTAKAQAQTAIQELNTAKEQAQATIAELSTAKENILAELANKLNVDSVTQSTSVTTAGYAVDARELNASISGSLAKKIKSLETGAFTGHGTYVFDGNSLPANLFGVYSVNQNIGAVIGFPANYGTVLAFYSLLLFFPWFSCDLLVNINTNGAWGGWKSIYN